MGGGWSERRWFRILRGGRGRPLGLGCLAFLVLLGLAAEDRPPWVGRLYWFDVYHSLMPRVWRPTTPVTIVEIDDGSLGRVGQWPWPRTQLARLVDLIGAGGPAAVGLDLLMPEPDRLSPTRLPALVPSLEPDVAERLARLPDSDAELGQALGRVPAVLGIAGLEEADAAAPGVESAAGPGSAAHVQGGDPRPFMRRFATTLRSLPVIDDAGRGHGLLNADPDAGVVRRLPIAAVVGPTVLPGFAAELLRVAHGEAGWGVRGSRHGMEAAEIGSLLVSTQSDGSAWVRFSPHAPERFVSAADVLDGRLDPAIFARRIVLLGVTALGLSDYQATPVGERMPGVEIHAQLVEAALEGRLLHRPRWAAWLEAAIVALGGLTLLVIAPRGRPRRSLAVLLILAAWTVGLGVLLYRGPGVLLDAASPILALTLVWAVMTAAGLAEADGQRRALRRQLGEEREAAARVAGELAAARRIQQSLLPDPREAFAGETRFAVAARLEPARVVGGDLYDFFRLDADRIFALIGDVSGKGMPGSLFMAVSKALCKSTALRAGGDLAGAVRQANREISRDNREAMFVTAFVVILDARTGGLAYLSAGHDAPYLLGGPADGLRRLRDSGGPPLGVIDEFPYEAASARIEAGVSLCLVTDGVTEARSRDGALYGRARLETLLAAIPPGRGPGEIADAVLDDVRRFGGGAEAADDVAVVVVRWLGPAGADAPVAAVSER